jgi:hypothetical protein
MLAPALAIAANANNVRSAKGLGAAVEPNASRQLALMSSTLLAARVLHKLDNVGVVVLLRLST